MAHNQEIASRREQQESVIEKFRRFYGEPKRSARELARVSLVSNHDPSVRFTNSTTSVMKPFFAGGKLVENTVYLAQPAMGQQGLQHWQKDRVFGPYASYFASLGALYPASHGKQALHEMIDIAETWDIPADELMFNLHHSDEDVAALIEGCGVNAVVDDSDEIGDFRHVYGIEAIRGRNANMQMRDRSQVLRSLGNLTLIHTEDLPIAYELSFDSPTVTSLVGKMAHPVNAHDERSALGTDDPEIARLDTLSVSVALLVESLPPVSKGRSGNLRKFLLEYMRLARHIDNASVADMTHILKETAKTELTFRGTMSPEAKASSSYEGAVNLIDQWTSRLNSALDKEETER